MTAMMLGQTAATAASGGGVSLSNATLFDLEIDPSNALVGLTAASNGALTYIGNGNPANPSDQWHVSQPNTGIGNGFEARLTVQSGSSPTSGAVNSWLALSSNRTWSLAQNVVGVASGSWLLEIRPTGGTPIASAVYSVSAQVDVI